VTDDYLDRDRLINLGIEEAEVDALLTASPLTGHDGRRVAEAERLPELLAELRNNTRGGGQV